MKAMCSPDKKEEITDGGDVLEIMETVLDAAEEVHRTLGPGLLASAYRECLCHELTLRGIPYERNVGLPVQYKGHAIPCGYRAELVIGSKLLVEFTHEGRLQALEETQVINHLKLTGLRSALLLNFDAADFRDAIRWFSVDDHGASHVYVTLW